MNKKDYESHLRVKGKKYYYYDLEKLSKKYKKIQNLPYSIKILVENLLRKLDNDTVTKEDIKNIADWQPKYDQPIEIPYLPFRVLMQDFTGVPAVADLASIRDVAAENGKDPSKIHPLTQVDLVVDHSVQIDYYGTLDSISKNVSLEYKRNQERYKMLKWAQNSFDNFSVVPPNSGICHQVNVEFIGKVIQSSRIGTKKYLFPDTVIGTDSHTPMINGIGVMGWGVGGIEAEAVMLGQPYYMPIPQVIGVNLTGSLKEGVTATDLALTLTQLLRKHKVVDKFVEYFGAGLKSLPITDRATVSNMTPEYGATLGFFPIDAQTIEYLKFTNRKETALIVEEYAHKNMMYYDESSTPQYTEIIDFDLSSVEPSVSGPSRPQDRIAVKDIAKKVDIDTKKYVQLNINGQQSIIRDGSVLIAAITSCTNTSNPYVMIGAGLVAKKAVEKGLKIPFYVKTSMAPGSKVVSKYLEKSGTIPYLEALGFHLSAIGCTTCIGNSGPINEKIESVINEKKLNVAAVLSGNRNFEARIHQAVRMNFLCSPMLVIIFALAGKVNIDFEHEPVGYNPNLEPVYLKDIWPSSNEIKELVSSSLSSSDYKKEYTKIYNGDTFWQELEIEASDTYKWEDDSTYIKKPPFFSNFTKEADNPENIQNARALLLLGDSVTTDHISPAGEIPDDTPAGLYLINKGVNSLDFNSYGSRRGNHEIMMRGTFANVRLKNKMIEGKEGGFTLKYPENQEGTIFDITEEYKNEGVPLIVFGGKEYGTGSSRDWAAKGTLLLGIKAVVAESFERIHKSNLVGMGVLPLEFINGESWKSLGISGNEVFNINGIDNLSPNAQLSIEVIKNDGSISSFTVKSRLDTKIEIEYYKNGGILPFVLRKKLF